MNKIRMELHKTDGRLITFCGLDGCGKTTMLTRLAETLQHNYSIMLTKQPTDFVRKSKIFRTYMDSPNHDAFDYRSLSLLAASDRVQHSRKTILPALQNQKIVLSDRYFYSCLANLRARGYTHDRWIYEIARSIIKPDIAFFFDLPVEQAVERVRSRPNEKNRFIDMELQYRLRREYIHICRACGGVLLSTEEPIDVTFEKVLTTVKHVF